MKAVAFDAYGTLLDTGTGSVDATRRILERNRSALDPGSIYQEWKSVHQQLIASLPEFETEEVIFRRGLRQIYEKYHLQGVPEEDISLMLATLGRRKMYPDAVACLDRLRGRYRIIIASNTDTQPLLQDIDRNHIVHDCLLTSEDLHIYKPNPEFYRQILKVGPYLPSEVVYVGDSLVQDVKGPGSVGMPAVWLNRKGQSAPDLDVPQIRSLAELTDLLHRMEAQANLAKVV